MKAKISLVCFYNSVLSDEILDPFKKKQKNLDFFLKVGK